MSITNHIASLRQKHAELDSEIDALAQKPGFDDVKLTQMKRERLAIKDQIEKHAEVPA
jgi:hypothetical protein